MLEKEVKKFVLALFLLNVACAHHKQLPEKDPQSIIDSQRTYDVDPHGSVILTLPELQQSTPLVVPSDVEKVTIPERTVHKAGSFLRQVAARAEVIKVKLQTQPVTSGSSTPVVVTRTITKTQYVQSKTAHPYMLLVGVGLCILYWFLKVFEHFIERKNKSLDVAQK